MFAQTQCEGFRPPFLKGGAGGGRVALLDLRRGRNPLTALFFLLTFSFAPIWSKEKVAMESEPTTVPLDYTPIISLSHLPVNNQEKEKTQRS